MAIILEKDWSTFANNGPTFLIHNERSMMMTEQFYANVRALIAQRGPAINFITQINEVARANNDKRRKASRVRAKKWRDNPDNHERINEYARTYRATHKEHIQAYRKEYNRTWRKSEKAKESDRRYREQNRERRNEQARQWRLAHKGYHTEYCRQWRLKKRLEKQQLTTTED